MLLPLAVNRQLLSSDAPPPPATSRCVQSDLVNIETYAGPTSELLLFYQAAWHLHQTEFRMDKYDMEKVRKNVICHKTRS